jgi:hypothetical protein
VNWKYSWRRLSFSSFPRQIKEWRNETMPRRRWWWRHEKRENRVRECLRERERERDREIMREGERERVSVREEVYESEKSKKERWEKKDKMREIDIVSEREE